jgi:hypothetical protein
MILKIGIKEKIKVTIFEEYMNESNKCTKMCKKYMNKDTNLAIFYNNASIGYKEKALNLSLEDADKMRA